MNSFARLLVTAALGFPLLPIGSQEPAYRNARLPESARVSDLVSRLTLAEKISLLSETPPAIPRLGIERYNYGNEALHGVIKPGAATVFPQAIGLAATWDPGLILRVATAISDEARGKYNATNGAVDTRTGRGRANGLLTFFSPTINMARDPRWGRTPETYGEDPYLTSRLAVQYVKGLQGDDPLHLKVLSTPKHFAANNEEFDRFKANAMISEGTLHEYYLPAFRAAITEGRAQSIMSSYNAINGIPSTANPVLLTDVLRRQWHFDGFVVTDCGAVAHLYAQHHYATSLADAAAKAINAGVDMECGSWSDTPYVFQNYLQKAVDDGLLQDGAIDRAVADILKVRFRLGLFDPLSANPYSKIAGSVVGSAKHVELARQAARESMVLLKNASLPATGKILPIDLMHTRTIAVVGPGAGVAEFGEYSGHPVHTPVTPLDGIRAQAGDHVRIEYAPWVDLIKAGESVTIPAAQMQPTDAKPGEHGLRGAYFSSKNLSGAAATRVDTAVNFDWLNLPPDEILSGDEFSVRWSGTLTPERTGEYKLTVATDDGVRLTLDGKVLVDAIEAVPRRVVSANNQWTPVVAKKMYSAAVLLTAGHAYPLTLEYRNQGGAYVKLNWTPPAGAVVDRFAREREVAKHADVVIAIMGRGSDQGAEGTDRYSLRLPADQEAFLREMVAANPRTVAVLVNGGPMQIPWAKLHVPAILEAWYPGEQGGNGIADVVFGHYNPAGRLPLTFYTSLEQIPPLDDYEISHGKTYMYLKGAPLFAFGHGLSYTHFRYSRLVVFPGSERSGAGLRVSFDVTNDGAKDGDEVVQLYTHRSVSGGTSPVRKLEGLERLTLARGQTRTITLGLNGDALSHYSTSTHSFVRNSGATTVEVGASSADIRLQSIVNLKDGVIVPSSKKR